MIALDGTNLGGEFGAFASDPADSVPNDAGGSFVAGAIHPLFPVLLAAADEAAPSGGAMPVGVAIESGAGDWGATIPAPAFGLQFQPVELAPPGFVDPVAALAQSKALDAQGATPAEVQTLTAAPGVAVGTVAPFDLWDAALYVGAGLVGLLLFGKYVGGGK